MHFPGHVSISRCENRYGPWLYSKEPSRYECKSTLLTGTLTVELAGTFPTMSSRGLDGEISDAEESFLAFLFCMTHENFTQCCYISL